MNKKIMYPDFGAFKNGWSLLWMFVIVLAGCSRATAPEGHYQDSAIVADGNAGDWSLPLRFGNESHTLQYNVTNDRKNIYICVLSANEITQLRILRFGMTVYFDPKGDKHKDISLHFPISKQPDPAGYRERNGNAARENDKSRIQELLLQSDYYGTTGFLDIENGQFALADTKPPIRVAMKLNDRDSMLVYEAIIPIKNIPGIKPGGKNFSVGIVLNGVQGQTERSYGSSAPSSGGGGMRGRGMGGGGMHGMGGGGMRGARQGNAMGSNRNVQEDANWYSFRLAGK
jgi:hypothetical protein